MFNILEPCMVGGEPVPDQLITIIQLVISLIKIGVPVLLIIFAMLDLGKAVAAQKEDEIKKGQQTALKRVIAAAVVFLVVVVVQLVIGLVAGDDTTWESVACIIGAK